MSISFIFIEILVIVAFSTELAGCTDLEQARADMIVNSIEDTAKPALKLFFEKDPDRKVSISCHEIFNKLKP